MRVIGVTGGLATGKTTVARMLERFGARRLDADAIAHQLLRSDRGIRRALARRFGTVDRRRLGAMVFRSPAHVRYMNRLLHPRVARVVQRQLAAWRRRHPQDIVVIDVPLLFEAGWHQHMMDGVVVVTARRAQQLQRCRRRLGLSPAACRRRLRAQWPLSHKVRLADWVIDNSGSTRETQRSVEALWKKLSARKKKEERPQ